MNAYAGIQFFKIFKEPQDFCLFLLQEINMAIHLRKS